MLSVDLVLCEACDYDCNYCTVKNHNNMITVEKLEKHKYLFEFIKKLHHKKLLAACVIQGGDIGKIPQNVLERFFEMIHPVVPTISCQKGFLNLACFLVVLMRSCN